MHSFLDRIYNLCIGTYRAILSTIHFLKWYIISIQRQFVIRLYKYNYT